MVTLAEGLFLLAHNDLTGKTVIAASHLDLGLGGALLLDLALRGRVALADSHVVAAAGAGATGDELLDGALAVVGADAHQREPEYWVRLMAKNAQTAVRERLITAGVLRPVDHKVFGLIPVHRLPLLDGRQEQELMRRMHDAVVDDVPADRETAALVSLTLAVGLEQHLFPRSDRREIRRRMQQIAGSEWVGPAVAHCIDALDAALGIVTPGPATGLR